MKKIMLKKPIFLFTIVLCIFLISSFIVYYVKNRNPVIKITTDLIKLKDETVKNNQYKYLITYEYTIEQLLDAPVKSMNCDTNGPINAAAGDVRITGDATSDFEDKYCVTTYSDVQKKSLKNSELANFSGKISDPNDTLIIAAMDKIKANLALQMNKDHKVDPLSDVKSQRLISVQFKRVELVLCDDSFSKTETLCLDAQGSPLGAYSKETIN